MIILRSISYYSINCSLNQCFKSLLNNLKITIIVQKIWSNTISSSTELIGFFPIGFFFQPYLPNVTRAINDDDDDDDNNNNNNKHLRNIKLTLLLSCLF